MPVLPLQSCSKRAMGQRMIFLPSVPREGVPMSLLLLVRRSHHARTCSSVHLCGWTHGGAPAPTPAEPGRGDDISCGGTLTLPPARLPPKLPPRLPPRPPPPLMLPPMLPPMPLPIGDTGLTSPVGKSMQPGATRATRPQSPTSKASTDKPRPLMSSWPLTPPAWKYCSAWECPTKGMAGAGGASTT